jgi:hypothetical protein
MKKRIGKVLFRIDFEKAGEIVDGLERDRTGE